MRASITDSIPVFLPHDSFVVVVVVFVVVVVVEMLFPAHFFTRRNLDVERPSYTNLNRLIGQIVSSITGETIPSISTIESNDVA